MHLVVWTVSGQCYGIETSSIVEVVPVVAARTMPGMPSWVRGLMDYRGALLPLVDTRQLFELGATEIRKSCRIVVVRLEDSGDAALGLLVESIEAVEHVEAGGEAHPGFDSADLPCLGAVVRTSQGSVQIVDPARVVREEHRAILFGHMSAEDA